MAKRNEKFYYDGCRFGYKEGLFDSMMFLRQSNKFDETTLKGLEEIIVAKLQELKNG